MKRRHRRDAPALQRIIATILVDADGAGPGRIPRTHLFAERFHEMANRLRGLTGLEIGQFIPQGMDGSVIRQ